MTLQPKKLFTDQQLKTSLEYAHWLLSHIEEKNTALWQGMAFKMCLALAAAVVHDPGETLTLNQVAATLGTYLRTGNTVPFDPPYATDDEPMLPGTTE